MMKRIGNELSVIFVDFRNSFLTKRVLVLFVLHFFVTHIFLASVRRFAVNVHYPVSAYGFLFLFYDMYYLLLFMFVCIYYFSNTPFLNYHQIYRIIRTGKLRWGIHQIVNIIISSVVLMGSVFVSACIVLFPQLTWENDWGKVLYTLSLTNMAEEYNIMVDFTYEMISRYTPLQLLGLTLGIGILLISFLGNMMFTVSLFFSRTAALSIASLEAAFIIVEANTLMFSKLIYFAPFTWMRLSRIWDLIGQSRPTPSIGDAALYLAAGNLVCIVLILWQVKDINYSKHIKKE